MKKNIGRLSQIRERGAGEMELVKSERFAGSEVDLYKGVNDEMYMTIDQLANALEYASKSAVENMLLRNEYLRGSEFSSTHDVWVDGKLRSTRLFTEDGIYEVTMLSKQPKAREFRSFVRSLLKDLKNGNIQIQQPMSTKDLLLQASLEHELRIEKVEKDVHTLIHETPIRNHQQVAIEKARKKVVLKALGGKKSNAYEELSRKVFSEIGRDFKDRFNVPRYNELPQSRYEEGLAYISRWRPSTNTQVLIDEANGQAVLWGDSE